MKMVVGLGHLCSAFIIVSHNLSPEELVKTCFKSAGTPLSEMKNSFKNEDIWKYILRKHIVKTNYHWATASGDSKIGFVSIIL